MIPLEQLPRSYEAEAAVLGCILTEPHLIDDCTLRPEMFYHEKNRLIMEFMLFLGEIGKPLDTVHLAQAAGENLNKIGGMTYLLELVGAVHTTAHFTHYQEMVSKLYVTRETMLTLSRKAEEGDSSTDPNQYIADTVAALETLLNTSSKDSGTEIKLMYTSVAKHRETIHKRKDKKGLTGAKSCSTQLNKMTGGHQDEDLIVTAARPSMGKTAFALNDAVVAARSYKNEQINGAVVFFSLEMGDLPIVERVLAIIGNIESDKMRTGEMEESDWERYNMAEKILKGLPLYIKDQSGQTLQSIEFEIKKLRKKYDKLYVIIDFLQLVDPGKKGLEGHSAIAYVSKGLKQIARRYKVPVNAISAVGRDCERRNDKRPMLSDLRESGSIESDADVVVFLYRDDYYNPNSEKKRIVELIVAKGRNVGTGTIEMAYIKNTNRFLDLDYSHHQQQKKG